MKRYLILMSVFLLAQLFAYSQKEGLSAISRESLKSYMEFFSSDQLRGREMGSVANEIASLYIKTTIQRMGLKPDVDDYFQHNPLTLVKNSPEGSYLNLKDKSGRQIFSTDSIMQLMPLSETLETEGEIVFAGFGYEDEAGEYSDLRDIDLKDKVVLLMTRTPELAGSGRKDISFSFATEEEKIGRLLKKGVKAFLYVFDPGLDEQDPFKTIYYQYSSQEQVISDGSGALNLPLVFGFIRPAVADSLLSSSGRTLKDLNDQILTTGKPASFNITGRSIAIRTAVSSHRTDGRNVIGIIEGSDPVLKKECVVYTAHFDHVGTDSRGEIYNGADDDASGSMAMLELANAFMKLKKKPLRSIVFVWANGEEKGLIGSAYYVRNPAIPLEKTLLDINLDMIGRSVTPADTGTFFGFDIDVTKKGEVMMYSKHESTELDKIIKKAASRTGMSIRDMGADIEAGGSDHESFWDKGVPAIMFHTGVHADTHQLTDDVDRIDFEKMEQVTKLVFLTGYEVANRKERIQLNKKLSE